MSDSTESEKGNVRVYNYGASFRKGADGRRPAMAAIVYEQLRAANIYYNKRVEIENGRRSEWRDIRRRCFPKLAEAEIAYAESDKAVADAREAVKAAKSSKRTRKVSPADSANLKNLRALRSAAKKHLSECRKEYESMLLPANTEFDRRYDLAVPNKGDVHQIRKAKQSILESMLSEDWPECWKLSRELDFKANEEKNRVRRESGLTKGTYDLVDAAFKQASRTSSDVIKFRRYSGGRVGLSVSSESDDTMLGRGSSFRIDPLPAGTWDTRSGRRHAVTNVRLRLGRGLQEIVFPIVMHRPLPAGSRIKAVWVKEEIFGMRRRYFLQVTVEERAVRQAPAGPVPGSLVAVNLSWKMVDGGLRSGYWVGSDGEEGEVLLRRLGPGSVHSRGNRSEYLYDSLVYPANLSTYIQKNFDFVMGIFLEKMKALEFPPWMKGDKNLLETVSRWRSPMRLCGYSIFLRDAVLTKDRMSALWRLWRSHRLGGDRKLDLMPVGPSALDEVSEWASGHGITDQMEVFSLFLEIWRRKHVHLYDWKNQTMDRAMRARRELYRVLARRLSERYETLLIEDFDLRDVAEDKAPECESDKFAGAGLNRTVACTSSLRSCLTQAFGGRYRKYPAAGNTMFHAGCGGAMVGDTDNVMMTCVKCGKTEDRDRNNCLNQIDTANGSSRKPHRAIAK